MLFQNGLLFCFLFEISLIFVVLLFLGASICLDAVLFLYSLIKDKLICVLQDMFPGFVLKLKFSPFFFKVASKLHFREDKWFVVYLIQYLFWMLYSVKTFANPWDSSACILPKRAVFQLTGMGIKTLKRQQHINWSTHAQTCCGNINKPACVPDWSRQMNNTHTHTPSCFCSLSPKEARWPDAGLLPCGATAEESKDHAAWGSEHPAGAQKLLWLKRNVDKLKSAVGPSQSWPF